MHVKHNSKHGLEANSKPTKPQMVAKLYSLHAIRPVRPLSVRAEVAERDGGVEGVKTSIDTKYRKGPEPLSALPQEVGLSENLKT